MIKLLFWWLAFVLSFQKVLQMDTCSDFWKQWKKIPCKNLTSEKQSRCFSFNQKYLKISDDISIDCNSQTIERHLYACIKKRVTKSFLIQNCIVLNLNLKDFLSGKTVSSIEIIETGEDLTTADMIVSDILSLKAFGMKGHKTRGRFNVTFSNLNNLRSIAVTNTSFTHFRNRPFRKLPYLQNLSFTYGILRSIPETLFKGLRNLKSLNLYHNRITSLRRGTFNDLASLRELDLTYNNLRVIIGGTFKPLTNLFQINVSHNPLAYLPDSYPFGLSDKLHTVRAINCKLTKTPNVNMMQHNLTLLDLSHNTIRTATLPVFTKNITTVNLTNNLIRNIRINLDKLSNTSPTYYIYNNALECDCENEEFLQFLQSDIQEEHRVFADAHKESCNNKKPIRLFKAWPEHVTCPISHCPDICSCSWKSRGIVVDCQDKGLQSPPDRIPFGTVAVLLQTNDVSSLSNLDSYSWQKVTDLFLDKNIFTALQHEFIPRKVNKLSIKDNKLTGLPTPLMAKAESDQDYKIALAGNDWQCVCQNVPFVNWFNRSRQKIEDWNKTFCTSYHDADHYSSFFEISKIPVHLLCINIFQFKIGFIILVLFLFVLLLFLAALFYHRTSILPLLYSYEMYPFYFDQKIAGDGGREFDVFMFYHRTDLEDAKAIVAKLESDHRICIPHGAWYPDQAVGHELLQSFECSRKTILLISRALILSSWFQVEFRSAFYSMKNKLNRFVLISVGETGDTEHLKADIRSFLTDRMSLKWKERCFWQKLRYALRHTVRNSRD